jgi:hypothetical protein
MAVTWATAAAAQDNHNPSNSARSCSTCSPLCDFAPDSAWLFFSHRDAKASTTLFKSATAVRTVFASLAPH